MAKTNKPMRRERLEDLPKPQEQPDIATPEKYGARPSKAHTCTSCGHSYLKPCNDNEKRKAQCANWNHILMSQKANPSKPKGKKK